jgi:HK97 gp10 family phage protein
MTAKSGLSLDTSEWTAALARLEPLLKVSLARSMAVAGGQLLLNEARSNAPAQSGKLRDALYLAFKDGKSDEKQVVYSVSWNSKKAPHGHLLEFGHWQPYKVVRLPNGDWFTDVTQPLPSPTWTPAHPFLRPAFDHAPRAQQAMIKRGRERLPELLAEVANGN